MHIKDFYLSEKTGGCSRDWDYLEDILDHLYNEWGIDLTQEELKEWNHIADGFYFAHNEIKQAMSEYLSKELGEEVSLDFDMYFNYLDSKLDDKGIFNWFDDKEEVLKTYKEQKEGE